MIYIKIKTKTKQIPLSSKIRIPYFDKSINFSNKNDKKVLQISFKLPKDFIIL